MSWFTRFKDVVFAQTGTVIPASDNEYSQGMEFLGRTKPSKQFFNSLFQDLDRRDKWLYEQIEALARVTSVTLLQTPLTGLKQAVENMASANFRNVITDYEMSAGDVGVLRCDAFANMTITLPVIAPAFPDHATRITLTRIDNRPFIVTVKGAGTNTVIGGGGQTVSLRNRCSLTLVSDTATTWRIEGMYQGERRAGELLITLGSLPPGYIPMDGRWLTKTSYPELYAAIGDTWGVNSTQFRLPDARGRALLGADAMFGGAAAGNTPGAVLGALVGSGTVSLTRAEMPRHGHTISVAADGLHDHQVSVSAAPAHAHVVTVNQGGNHDHGGQTSRGGNHVHSVDCGPSGEHTHVTPVFLDRGGNTVQTPENAVFGDEPYYGAFNVPSLPSGDHRHSITVNQSGDHIHGIPVSGTHTHSAYTDTTGDHTHSVGVGGAGTHSHAATASEEGGGAPFSVVQPSIGFNVAVYAGT